MPIPKEKYEYCYLYFSENRSKGGYSVSITDASGNRDISKDFDEGLSPYHLLLKVLNLLGAEGWELMSFSNKEMGDSYFMKRRVQE